MRHGPECLPTPPCPHQTNFKHLILTMFTTALHWKSRLTAAGIHLGISLILASLAAALVFGVWYPYPFREISGGRSLFMLIVSVDVVLGPLLTLAVFNRNKPLAELRRDLVIIALLQLTALTYGLWTVAVARPVYLVFEVDRYRVVHAIEVHPDSLVNAPPALQELSWTGPKLISLRDFKNDEERSDLTLAAARGLQISELPHMWQSHEQAIPAIQARARSLNELRQRFPERTDEIDLALRSAGHSTGNTDSVVYLPLVSRGSQYWTALLDRQTTEIIAYLPLDPL